MTLASIFSLSVSSASGAAKLVRRLRASQFPSPQAERGDAESVACLDAFLDRLIELPLTEWLAIGNSVVAERDRVFVRQQAWNELEAALLHGRFGVAVWRVRDAVDTAAYIAARESHTWSRHERGTFAAAHGAAETAALALLARDHLSPATYGALTGPFAACISVAQST